MNRMLTQPVCIAVGASSGVARVSPFYNPPDRNGSLTSCHATSSERGGLTIYDVPDPPRGSGNFRHCRSIRRPASRKAHSSIDAGRSLNSLPTKGKSASRRVQGRSVNKWTGGSRSGRHQPYTLPVSPVVPSYSGALAMGNERPIADIRLMSAFPESGNLNGA